VATDLVPTIPDSAAAPGSTTFDGLTVTERPIMDQILADRYAKANAAAALPKRGLRFTRLLGPVQCPTSASLSDSSDDGDGADGSYG
jgi:hypothetical protein